MATIDKIQVQGTTYDINLPATASPTISSLTITGNLTVSGTANLSVVNCAGDTLCVNFSGTMIEITTASGSLASGAHTGIGAYPGGSFEVYGESGLYLTSDDALLMSVNGNLTCSVANNLTVSYDNELYINKHYIDFPFNSGAFEYTFPKKSGTLMVGKNECITLIQGVIQVEWTDNHGDWATVIWISGNHQMSFSDFEDWCYRHHIDDYNGNSGYNQYGGYVYGKLTVDDDLLAPGFPSGGMYYTAFNVSSLGGEAGTRVVAFRADPDYFYVGTLSSNSSTSISWHSCTTDPKFTFLNIVPIPKIVY